jgi:3-phenylpropionate/trans-cinnamate dioxygenase alpha subunit
MPPIIKEYYLKHFPELEQRLGPVRAKQMVSTVSTIFPNASPHMRAQFRVYNPKGPTKTEIWVYCIVDKEAPAEVKSAMKNHLNKTFGPSGGLEQDDMNNWIQCTASGSGWLGLKYPANVAMGIGHEGVHEDLRGKIGPSPGELNQREFYSRWAQMMDAPSWSQIALDPEAK